MIGFAGRDLATRAAKPNLTNAQLGSAGFLMLSLAGATVLVFSHAPLILPSAAALPALIGAALFATLGYGALTNAMRTGDVSVVTPFRYTRLIFALILGTLFFAETPDSLTLFGAAMIVGCGALLMRR
jgi:drug/metabolite transporter (DMT)-like permease